MSNDFTLDQLKILRHLVESQIDNIEIITEDLHSYRHELYALNGLLLNLIQKKSRI